MKQEYLALRMNRAKRTLEVTMRTLQQARIEVAAAHRLAVQHGLNEGVWNHISLLSPEDPSQMLISPGHTHWAQVNASNLALLDAKGELVSGEIAPIRAGWIIHFPVHQARPDATCVMHVHAPYITAMSIRRDICFETRSSQQSARFHDDVVYFDEYDGVLKDMGEGERMAAALGDKRVLLMRNHGALVVGPSVAAVYLDVYQLERACMYQLLAIAGGGQMQLIPEEVAVAVTKQAREGFNLEHFDGMLRWIKELEPDLED